jgi:hypothetical protein
MLSETAQDVRDLAELARKQTEALEQYGTLLTAIADTASKTQILLQIMSSRLNDVSGWLHFNLNFAAEGWLRFHALNRAIPFRGREEELAQLRNFLNSPEKAFSWWIVTGPGGAGKTRLALELCARMYARGWQVGFLRRNDAMPEAGWRLSRPLLIIADYATEQVDRVRELARTLAGFGESVPAVRLLMLERAADEFFLRRFYEATGGEQGTLIAHRYRPHWLKLPGLSEDELWALVENCPWRASPAALPLARRDFFARLQQVDKSRRALVAMLIADDAVTRNGAPGVRDLEDVLREVLRAARTYHWPRELGAKDRRIGKAQPADTLIAAASMTGWLERDFLDAVETALGTRIEGDVLDRCAHAIGSPQFEGLRRLEGIEPDLIGEFFALEALVGDARDAPPAPWLPVLAWRADEEKMAGFVTRARQNFAEHRALAQINITVPGVLESWWLSAMAVWDGG